MSSKCNQSLVMTWRLCCGQVSCQMEYFNNPYLYSIRVNENICLFNFSPTSKTDIIIFIRHNMRTVMTNKNGKTFILSGCLSKLEIPPCPLKLSEPEGRDWVRSQSRVVKCFANHTT